jgi:Smg protein
MNEAVMDVLVYVFEHLLVDDANLTATDRLLGQLVDVGFSRAASKRALAWLETLPHSTSPQLLPAASGFSQRSCETASEGSMRGAPNTLRLYNDDECARLDFECRGFLLYLEQIGVLGATEREWVIDRAMALDAGDLDVEDLKWVVLFVLYNQPGQEQAVAWLEKHIGDPLAYRAH